MLLYHPHSTEVVIHHLEKWQPASWIWPWYLKMFCLSLSPSLPPSIAIYLSRFNSSIPLKCFFLTCGYPAKFGMNLTDPFPIRSPLTPAPGYAGPGGPCGGPWLWKGGRQSGPWLKPEPMGPLGLGAPWHGNVDIAYYHIWLYLNDSNRIHVDDFRCLSLCVRTCGLPRGKERERDFIRLD